MEPFQYEQLRIHTGTWWDVYVSDRGANNLGRLYFWLRRDGIVDFHELTIDELLELRTLVRRFSAAIRALFKPDGPINFAYLANEPSHHHHCHYHLVPRYKKPRNFNGQTFIDPTPTKQWTSAPLEPALAQAIGQAIMSFVNEHLTDVGESLTQHKPRELPK